MTLATRSHLVSYTIAYFMTIIILVYLLGLPTLVTGARNLSREYYSKASNILLEFVVVAIYIRAAPLSCTTDALAPLVVFATALALSTLFCILFQNTKGTTFFHRWFRTVGLKGVLYDAIVVSAVYIVYRFTL